MLLTVALAGCGGSSSQSSTTPAPLARPTFVHDADVICARYNPTAAQVNRDVAKVQRNRKLSDEVRITRVQSLLSDGAAAVRNGLIELRTLSPPLADRPRIRTWLALRDEQLRLIDTYRSDIGTGDATAARTAARRANALEGRAQRTVRGYGFRVCGRP